MRRILAVLALAAALLAPSPAHAVSYDCGAWSVSYSGQLVSRKCSNGPGESYAILLTACGATGCRSFWSEPTWRPYGGACKAVVDLRGSGYYLSPGSQTLQNSPATKTC